MRVLDRLRALSHNPIAGWWALLMAGMMAWIAHFHGHILADLDGVLLVGGGDGIKNYFTLMWHARYDHSFLHYTGSGFPYGEQVFFTDGHPLLGWILQVLPFLAPHGVAVLNLALLMGLMVCASCLFGILRRSDLAPWAAAIGAFSITVLQPQIFRMGGHLSLAHAWMIPLILLLLLRTRTSERWMKWSLITAGALLACFLTHPYAGFMCVLLALGYHVLILVFDRSARRVRYIVQPLIMAVVPITLFLLLLGWNDPVMDRPVTPHGGDQYATTLMSLIVPTHDPFATPLREYFKYDALDWETWCYLGLSSLLVLILAGGVQVKRWTSRQAHRGFDDAGALLGAGFLVLLFAMGVWQDWLGEWLPGLAQFRGTGRFAWVFYFTCTIFCTIRTYHWIFDASDVRQGMAAASFVIVIGFYAVEGWAYHKDVGSSLGHTPNVFRADKLDTEQRALVDAVDHSGAVAIIPLPYQHVGSEYYQKDAPEGLLAEVLPLVHHTGLPLMAGITSRASLQHTRELLALRAPSYFKKQIAQAIPAEARFVLFHADGALEPEEQALWEKGTPLDGRERLRTIDATTLFAYDGDERLRRYAASGEHYPLHYGWHIDTMARGAHLIAHLHLRTDSVTGRVREYTTLLEIPAGVLDTAITYELSFIFRSLEPAAINISLILEHMRADGSDMHWGPMRNVRSMPMQHPGATTATLIFTPTGSDRSHKFMLKGPDDMGDLFSASHIVLRPVQVDCWREGSWNGDRTVFLNNVPITSGAPGP